MDHDDRVFGSGLIVGILLGAVLTALICAAISAPNSEEALIIARGTFLDYKIEPVAYGLFLGIKENECSLISVKHDWFVSWAEKETMPCQS